MRKYYLKWSSEKPGHPADAYGDSWVTGVIDYKQIQPPHKSLAQFKEEMMEKYTSLLKEHDETGKIRKLCDIVNPTDIEKAGIEIDPNFIKWCN